MKALVYRGPWKLSVEERDIPVPAKGEVQIKIHTVSICGSDLRAYRYISDRFKPPLVLGHEFSGDITAVGEGAGLYQVGQRVAVNPMIPCGKCYFCKCGKGNLCGNRRSLGTTIGGIQTHGAMQEYITVPEWMIVPISDNVSYQSAALLEPCGVTLACAKKGHTEQEQSVAVLGVGPIGLLIIKFLKALGVPKIIASDIIDKRLEKAKECGADYVFNSAKVNLVEEVRKLTDGYGVDRAINAAGEFVINQSFQLIKHGGTSVLVALTHDKIEIDPMEIVGRELKFVGSYMFSTEMAEAEQMLAQGKLVVEDLITSTYSLEEGKTAFDILSQPDNDEIKVQIKL